MRHPPAPSPRWPWVATAVRAFYVRRERWTLTWKARLLILAVLVGAIVIFGRELCAFLSITSPVGGQILVVEGWMPVYAFREATSLFHKGGYRAIVSAEVLSDDQDTSEYLRERSGAEKLMYLGVPSNVVVTVHADDVVRDRTFHSAKAVKKWLQEQSVATTSIDIVTLGPHSRRSRLLFERALGDMIQVGVISIEDRQFDPNHWWRSSAGVRRVIDEFIAYLYARISFALPR